MTHIVNGRVVEKKPFSLMALLYAILNYIHLFISTLLPGSAPINERVDAFNDARRPPWTRQGGPGGSGGRPGANIRGVDNRKTSAGACGGGGGG